MKTSKKIKDLISSLRHIYILNFSPDSGTLGQQSTDLSEAREAAVLP